jgi:hypothetical protein
LPSWKEFVRDKTLLKVPDCPRPGMKRGLKRATASMLKETDSIVSDARGLLQHSLQAGFTADRALHLSCP